MRDDHKRTRNIIQSFESQALRKRRWDFRFADNLTLFFGSIIFMLINVVFISLWFTLKVGDHLALGLILTVESVILMVNILMSQIRQNQTSTLRSELQLQVSLITERELTKVLKLIRLILRKQGVDVKNDMELEEMLDEIDASYIERQLEQDIETSKQSLTDKIAEPFVKMEEKLTEGQDNKEDKG